MLGFVAGYHADRFAVFAWGGHSFAARPDRARRVGLEWRNPTSAGIGAELAIAPRLSMLTQVEWETSVLEALDETHANRDQVLIWIGGRWAFQDRASLEFSVGEDLVRNLSPDVSFAFSLRFRL